MNSSPNQIFSEYVEPWRGTQWRGTRYPGPKSCEHLGNWQGASFEKDPKNRRERETLDEMHANWKNSGLYMNYHVHAYCCAWNSITAQIKLRVRMDNGTTHVDSSRRIAYFLQIWLVT